MKVIDSLSSIHVIHGTNLAQRNPNMPYLGSWVASDKLTTEILLTTNAINNLLRTNIPLYEIKSAFILGLLRYFSSFAFIFKPVLPPPLIRYGESIPRYAPFVKEFIKSLCPIERTDSFDSGIYFSTAFITSTGVEPNQEYVSQRAKQIESSKERLKCWQEVFDGNLSEKLYTFKYIEAESKGFTDTTLLELLFAQEFFHSIEGCYIPDFEPAALLYKRANLPHPQLSHALSLISRYSKAI